MIVVYDVVVYDDDDDDDDVCLVLVAKLPWK